MFQHRITECLFFFFFLFLFSLCIFVFALSLYLWYYLNCLEQLGICILILFLNGLNLTFFWLFYLYFVVKSIKNSSLCLYLGGAKWRILQKRVTAKIKFENLFSVFFYITVCIFIMLSWQCLFYV